MSELIKGSIRESGDVDLDDIFDWLIADRTEASLLCAFVAVVDVMTRHKEAVSSASFAPFAVAHIPCGSCF